MTTTCGKGNHAIQSRRYHFYQYEDGSNELYDQAEDPTEWHNLASSMQHQPVIAKLLQKLPKEDAEPSVLNEYPTNEHFLSK